MVLAHITDPSQGWATALPASRGSSCLLTKTQRGGSAPLTDGSQEQRSLGTYPTSLPSDRSTHGPCSRRGAARAGAQAERGEAARASEEGEALRAACACQAGNPQRRYHHPELTQGRAGCTPQPARTHSGETTPLQTAAKGEHRQEPMPRGTADPQSHLHRLLDAQKTLSETSLLLGRMIPNIHAHSTLA